VRQHQHHSVCHTGTTFKIKLCCEPQSTITCNKIAPASNKDEQAAISKREALSSSSADVQDTDVTKASNSLSPELRATLQSLGMTDGAFVSWEAMHMSPVRAMLYFFISLSVMFATNAYIVFAGVPLDRLYFTIPSFCVLGCIFGHMWAFWRYGPAVAKARLHLMTLAVVWICSVTTVTIR
jgi:hypothetical protein